MDLLFFTGLILIAMFGGFCISYFFIKDFKREELRHAKDNINHWKRICEILENKNKLKAE